MVKNESCNCEYHSRNIKQIKLSEADIKMLSGFYKAFSDPLRLKIIMALSHEELCVHDICRITGMEQSAVSHKLAYLRKLHIVKPERCGKSIFYSLDDNHVELILSMGIDHILHIHEGAGQ